MRVIRGPEAPGNPPDLSTNKKRLIVHRSASLSHGGELSRAKGYCRILRSYSASTASTIPESKTKKHTTRENPAVDQLVSLLSQGSTSVSSAPCRRMSGSTAPTSTCRGTESRNGSQHHRKHVRRHTLETSYPSTILSRSSARAVLSQARQSAALEAAFLGRKPAVMDIILDLRSTALDDDLDDDDDLLMGGLRRPPMRFSVCREYVFTDEQSLVIYWADQAAIWGGMRMIDSEVTTTRFPDSGERSTASWDPSLNGSQSGD